MKSIRLPEDLGIKKARKFYEAARMVMDAGQDCVVDFSKVRRIDLSAAQIVIALQRGCARRGGTCEIRNANDVTARLLEYAGVKQHVRH